MSSVHKWRNENASPETVKKLQLLMDEAEAKLREAAEFARANDLSFTVDGPSYGMGGTFDPDRTEDNYGNESDGWLASSQSC